MSEKDLIRERVEILQAKVDQAFKSHGITADKLTPGHYRRRWQGYEVPVEIRRVQDEVVVV